MHEWAWICKNWVDLFEKHANYNYQWGHNYLLQGEGTGIILICGHQLNNNSDDGLILHLKEWKKKWINDKFNDFHELKCIKAKYGNKDIYVV